MGLGIPKAAIIMVITVPIVIALVGGMLNMWQAPFDKALVSALIIGAITSLVLTSLFYLVKRDFITDRPVWFLHSASGLIFGLVIGLVTVIAGQGFGLFEKPWKYLIISGILIGLILGIIGRLVFRRSQTTE
jgi:uncharacterized membrane protein (UPF0136 family)